jgi:putative glutamine amidotransferase
LSKPIIGITVDCKREYDNPRTKGLLSLNWNYSEAVAEAGGVPILISPHSDMDAVSEIIDGWLIPGGNDIDAKHFGEENHETVQLIEEARFDGETRLINAIDREMPILGICYGCQFVNVARGGSLIQHLPAVEGKETHTGGVLQNYVLDGESKVAEIVQDRAIAGKSYHHQAIDKVGAGLRATAHSEDGTIEAIEDPSHPWLIGLQWHPERTMEDEKTRRIFSEFVNAAADFRKARMAVGARG